MEKYEPKDKTSYFIIYSTRAISEGESLKIKFGNRSNKYLLLNYGFAIENNKYDSFTFRLISNEEIEKMVYLGYEDIPNVTSEFRLKQEVCLELVDFFRL